MPVSASGCVLHVRLAESQPELLPEDPSMAGVDLMGVCGSGPRLCLAPIMALRGLRSFQDTRQTSLIRVITLS